MNKSVGGKEIVHRDSCVCVCVCVCAVSQIFMKQIIVPIDNMK